MCLLSYHVLFAADLAQPLARILLTSLSLPIWIAVDSENLANVIISIATKLQQPSAALPFTFLQFVCLFLFICCLLERALLQLLLWLVKRFLYKLIYLN